jgi:outer membrane protein TolC
MQIVDTLLGIERARLTLMQRAVATGATTPQAVDGQSRLISDLESQLPALTQQRAAAENALAVLSGTLPTQWFDSTLELDDFVLPASLPLTIPSALASQRPDIQAAEAHLRAASAAVGIAVSNRYPHIVLRGSLSQQGVFSGPSGLAWNAIGGLTAPLFDGGSLRAAQRAAEADYSAAEATYRQVVLAAFGQVADGLQALEGDAKIRTSSEAALNSSSGSLARAEKAYSAGGASEMQKLDALREQQARAYQVIEVRAKQLTDSAALILSTAGTIAKPYDNGSMNRRRS